jgi:DNA modification methylase
MKLKTVSLKALKPAPWNPRESLQPGEHEYEAIKASLNEFGLVQPLVFNRKSGFLVGGHQRRQVMLDQGITECQVVEVDLDEAAERKLNIQLNGTGRWDEDKLASLLAEMKGQSIDLGSLGFSKTEIADLLTKAKPKPKQDPDAPAPPTTVAVTKPGDIYELWTEGSATRHRVMCGDSCDPEQMHRLMDGQKARLVFIDPPYGVSYESAETSRPGTRPRYQGAIANDNLRAGNLVQFLARAFERLHESTIDRAALYCFFASCNHIEFETALIETGWRVKQELIWAKQMVLSRSDYHWAHEPLLSCAKAGQNSEWLGDRTETTLLDEDAPDIEKMSKDEMRDLLRQIQQNSTYWQESRDSAPSLIHPTQKPTSLSRRALRNSSLPGEIVIDSFLGSGSTLVGAELEGRVCFGSELDPCYVDAAVARFGKTFEHAHTSLNGKQYE